MYHPLVYHLDLCILAYHLYHQSLVFPMDPYYESMTGGLTSSRRTNFMTQAKQTVNAINGAPPYNTIDEQLNGPGSTSAWNADIKLDPILTNYGQLNPWYPSVIRAVGTWDVLYPQKIVSQIGRLFMVNYTSDPNQKNATVIQNPAAKLSPSGGTEPDQLYCFEGGTGFYGEPRSNGAWSMMGFALVHQIAGGGANDYTVHIVFRGSRSGAAGRAGYQGGGIHKYGNPDWVSDLNFTTDEDDFISHYGKSFRGFRHSIKSMLPTIVKALELIHTSKNNTAPKTIYVSGHSLGGGLASCFTSAVTNGIAYGPHGQGQLMPTPLKSWPWRSLQLISFSAPRIGNTALHYHFDRNIAARRVWGTGDPITNAMSLKRYVAKKSPLLTGRTNVGVSIEVPVPQGLDPFNPHNPHVVRRNLLKWIKKMESDKVQKPWPASVPKIEEHLLDNVPANSGAEELTEPWRNFKNYRAVLTHLDALHQVQGFLPQNFNVSQCIPANFGKHFRLYLQILQGILTKQPDQTKMTALLSNNPHSHNSLLAVMKNGIADPIRRSFIANACENALGIKDQKVHDLICLGLFITGLKMDSTLKAKSVTPQYAYYQLINRV